MTAEERNKRPRCPDESFRNQAKQYIVQRRLDLNNPDTMRAIFNKTLNLMYAGALRKKKIQDDNIENDNSAMDIDNTDDNMDGGSAEVESVSDQEPANETVQEEPLEIIDCSICINQTVEGSRVCKNCNLKMCLDCRIFCTSCDEDLCVNCVNIFGCTYDTFAMCELCKHFVR